MDARTVGVLGAGQLGRMFVEAAARLNVRVLLLDAGNTAPAKQISSLQPKTDGSQDDSHLGHIDGPFSDPAAIKQLAQRADILTIEIEHVNTATLQEVLDAKLVADVQPRPQTIALIQDKYAQKLHLQSHKLPLGDFIIIGPAPEEQGASASAAGVAAAQLADAKRAGETFGFPFMLKSRRHAYDGKGNAVVRSAETLEATVKALGKEGKQGLYAERWVPFQFEVAVMVVRSVTGEVRAYPAVETVHRDNICHTVTAPLRPHFTPTKIHADAAASSSSEGSSSSRPSLTAAGFPDHTLAKRAEQIAKQAVASFEGAGVFGVELFLSQSGTLLINEIAPRPHNSGHYTIEACETSQYENHLRAILGLPLGSTALKVPAAGMINILGLSDLEEDAIAVERTYAMAVRSLSVPGATAHLYGKSGCRVGRKMGHVTVVGQTDAEVAQRLQAVNDALERARASAAGKSGAALDEDITLAGAIKAAAASASASSSSTSASLPPAPAPTPADWSHPHPLVGIVMGSDSDLPTMLPAAKILSQFQIPYELTIVSAHRTVDRLVSYARTARARGLRAIVAGAGGAAHLPGMLAAQTVLPVVGVPVKGSALDGVDSMHSILQMPRGIPVATVAINNSTNGALLAIRMLGVPEYLDKMETYMRNMEEEVGGKINRMGEQGWDYVVKR
ncbi:phosphoribosylaminoimidazole carboxylase ade2 [Tilletia horrida]|uniref:Phosphoribosylaminoimidazole carboxylase n=1 Tax=Tilletia horrida TaxID=155126 RepID=A0AAN6G8L9_9BASI|nr:phosphoribosylaminoimidazole carboxylase ade2 [Tilletia horrida]KAK0545100.1 phosphoribosylaminoimidazole carboxylase ade2 [Tilletia horrida]